MRAVGDIDNVNHVGMAVRDLAATTARFEALGFQLTPYSPHSGAWKPGDAVQPLGSGNRCVMFADNYLEILASDHPRRQAERIAGFLAHHEGGHIICFNAENMQAVDDRLRRAGVATSGVIPLQREIDTPDGRQTAKFERVQFAPCRVAGRVYPGGTSPDAALHLSAALLRACEWLPDTVGRHARRR